MRANRVKALLYCTKSGVILGAANYHDNCYADCIIGTNKKFVEDFAGPGNILNGKIVASCDIETEKIKCRGYHQCDVYDGHNMDAIEKDFCYFSAGSARSSPEFHDLMNKCDMGFDRLDAYLKQKDGYALHISNLFIFENPAELSDYAVDHSADYFKESAPEYDESFRQARKSICFNFRPSCTSI